LLLQTTPSHANADETCTVAGGSADTPHLIDGFGDTTLTTGTDPAIEALDPTDLLAGWFARDEAGVVTANMKVQNLIEPFANVVYYMRWDYKGSDDAIKTTRWVSVQPRPSLPAGLPVAYGPRYRWGYLDTTTVGVQTLVAEGESTGSVTYGSPGTMSIVVPLDKMGKPGPGALRRRRPRSQVDWSPRPTTPRMHSSSAPTSKSDRFCETRRGGHRPPL